MVSDDLSLSKRPPPTGLAQGCLRTHSRPFAPRPAAAIRIAAIRIRRLGAHGHYNVFRRVPGDDEFGRFLRAQIDFLVDLKGRDVDEVPLAGIDRLLQLFTKSEAASSSQEIHPRLRFAMVVRSTFCAGIHLDESHPEVFGADQPSVDTRLAPESRRLSGA